MRRALALCLLLAVAPAGPAFAGADGGSGSGGSDSVGLGDLGSVAKIDPKTKKALDAHLAKARALMDRGDFKNAKKELDAADDLVPMQDDVVRLESQLGQLQQEAKSDKGLVKRLERERRQKTSRAAEAREARRKLAETIRDIERRNHLPHRLGPAILRLAHERKDAQKTVDAAREKQDECIGAAALAHAAAGARRCKEQDARVETLEHAVDSIDSDLGVLEGVYQDRHGKRALRRLKRRAGLH